MEARLEALKLEEERRSAKKAEKAEKELMVTPPRPVRGDHPDRWKNEPVIFPPIRVATKADVTSGGKKKKTIAEVHHLVKGIPPSKLRVHPRSSEWAKNADKG